MENFHRFPAARLSTYQLWCSHSLTPDELFLLLAEATCALDPLAPSGTLPHQFPTLLPAASVFLLHWIIFIILQAAISPIWKKDSLNPSSHPTYYLLSLPPFLAVFFTGVVYIYSLIFPHSFFAIVFDPLHAFRTNFVKITGNPVLLSCIILYCVT